MVYRESLYWQVESSVLHGPNVISAMIASRNSRFGIVSAYIPPTITTTSEHIAAALSRFPNWKVILVADLNLNLDSIETDRNMEIANTLADFGLMDMYHHFKLCCKFKQQNTWHQKRKGYVVRSRPDYFLCLD